MSADVGPPSSIVAAWMTQRAGMSPAVVSTASPSPIGAAPIALALHRRAAGPRDRARDAAAVGELGVRRVGDRVDLERRDVGLEDLDVAAIAARGLGDFGRLVLALQALAAALDGRDELREVDLERVEDLVGVVLGAEADLALAGAGVLDDVLGRALGLLGDLLLGDQLRSGARAPP